MNIIYLCNCLVNTWCIIFWWIHACWFYNSPSMKQQQQELSALILRSGTADNCCLLNLWCINFCAYIYIMLILLFLLPSKQ
jgi:hypothetical protein